MEKYIKNALRKLFVKTVDKRSAEANITYVANISGIDLLNLAHQSVGVMKYWDSEVSGESFVINEIIKNYFDFSNGRQPIIFDVGANVGNYTCQLAELYPQVRLLSFEPNPSTFDKLRNNTLLYKNIELFNIGLGSSKKLMSIYTYEDDLESEHASVYKGVLNDLHLSNKLIEKEILIETIDDFCENNNVDKIDFLKIDTEGFEYEVLSGMKSTIIESKATLIQFEFNEMNVISRVFLKDFYDLLVDYSFFRIDSKRLIPLYSYSSRNEIFQFQNILAIHKKAKVYE